MQLTIQEHNCQVSEELKEHVKRRLEKLSRFFNNIQRVEVLFDQIHGGGGDSPYRVEIKVTVPKAFFRADEASTSFRGSFDLAFDVVEREIRRFKEKLVDRSHGDR